jgi:CRISPR-associated exonuclease Cas4
LQHLAFCERQWALIHLEHVWDENVLTTEGRHLHERVHAGEAERRGDMRIARALRLRSLRLGLSGVADLVEFHTCCEGEPGAALPGLPGRWRAVPVEYKRGRPKANRCDEVQLCAQALCLEEMLDAPVAAGALFYGQTRRRVEVVFDAPLRNETEALAARLHALVAAGETPPPVFTPACANCSIHAACLPKVTGGRSARTWLDRAVAASLRPGLEGEAS